MRRLDQEVAAAEDAAGETHAPRPSPAAAAPPKANDAAALGVAQRWFRALAAGKAGAMVAMAVLPFRTGSKEVARRDALEAMLVDLAREASGTSADVPVEVHTTASLRSAIGKLPPNLDDGSGEQLYALAASGPHDILILVLSQRGGQWRPVGFVRR
jgi:hypothetical protein